VKHCYVKQPKYLITQLNKVSWQSRISLNVTPLNPERKVGRLETTIAFASRLYKDFLWIKTHESGYFLMKY
jgi:hypothetical protein